MPSEPHWITADIVIELNRALLAGTSEPHVLVSPDLLAGACERPHNHWWYEDVEDVVALATVLLIAIAENHPFLQGNKRTAFAAMQIFLEDNGYRLTLSDDAQFADDLVAVLEDALPPEEFETRLRRVVKPMD